MSVTIFGVLDDPVEQPVCAEPGEDCPEKFPNCEEEVAEAESAEKGVEEGGFAVLLAEC